MTQNLQIALAPPAAHPAPGRETPAVDGGDFDGLLREQLGAASDAAMPNAPASGAPVPAGDPAAPHAQSAGGSVQQAEKPPVSPVPPAAPPDSTSAADPEMIPGLMAPVAPPVVPERAAEAADAVALSLTGVAAAVTGALAGRAPGVPLSVVAPVHTALETGIWPQPGPPLSSSPAMPAPAAVSSPVVSRAARAEEAAARTRRDGAAAPAARADLLTPAARASGTPVQPPIAGGAGASSQLNASATPRDAPALATPGVLTKGATLRSPPVPAAAAEPRLDAAATPTTRPVPPMSAAAAPGAASQPASAIEAAVNTGRDAVTMSAGRTAASRPASFMETSVTAGRDAVPAPVRGSVPAMSATGAPGMALRPPSSPSPAVEASAKLPPDVLAEATGQSPMLAPAAASSSLAPQPSSGLEAPAAARLDAMVRPAVRPAPIPPAAIESSRTLQLPPGVEAVAKTALEARTKSVEAPTVGGLPGPATTMTAPLVNLPAAQPTAGPPLEVLPPVNTPVADPDWGSAMGARLAWSVAQGVQSATIALNPRELGPLQLTLTVSEDEASVSFVSNHGAVREAIEAALPRLRELFASDGLVLREVAVSADDGHAGNGQPGAGDGERADGGRGEVPAEATAAIPTRRVDGLVDTFA